MAGEGDQRTATFETSIPSGGQPEQTGFPQTVQQPSATTPPIETQVVQNGQEGSVATEKALEAAREEARKNKELADFYKKLYSSPQVPPTPQQRMQEDPISISDDDLVDGATLKKILAQQANELQAIREHNERVAIEASAMRLRSIDNDFDNKFNLGMEVVGANPGFQRALEVEADKVKFIYELAKFHPAFNQSQPSNIQQVEQRLQTIENNSQRVQTLSGVQGISGTQQNWKDMKNEDFALVMKKMHDQI